MDSRRSERRNGRRAVLTLALVLAGLPSLAAAQTASVTATWDAVPGVAGYTLEYGTDPNVFTESVNVGNVTSYPVSVLIGQTYYFVVKAYNGTGGTSSASALASGGIFTDRPLVVGTTSVKAAHLTELRSRIDAARLVRGLPAYSWSEAVTAGSSINAQHVTEMRTALVAAFEAEEPALSAPTYTDTPLTAGTVVKAVHFSELRTAVEQLEATP